VEWLECRRQLSTATGPVALSRPPIAEPLELPPEIASATAPVRSAAAMAASSPLSAVPVLNSLPSARAQLYLDFDGDSRSSWDFYSNVVTPAFDQDGDASTFSSGELATIQRIWEYVAEDYAPFNINVTTVRPASFNDGVAQQIAIGGAGTWYGGHYGGLSDIGSFVDNFADNVSFVFSKNLGNGNAKYTADAISHEAGHAFGLDHQSSYDAQGRKLREYSTGPGDGRAPLMGNSYNAARSLWWNGPNAVSSTTMQDDVAILAGWRNGFGFRADDYGNTASTAAPLTAVGGAVTVSGVITKLDDLDSFSLNSVGGTATFTVTPPANIANLDARIELRSGDGATIIASSDPSGTGSATVTTTLSAGVFTVVVASHGSYGDLGQYTLQGTYNAAPPPPPTSVAAPTSLNWISASSTQISLRWKDNATNEQVYIVQRAAGVGAWQTVATLAANATSFVNNGLAAGQSYAFRVYAVGAAAISAYSNTASAVTRPATPTGLTLAYGASGVVLRWNDVTGETVYRIQRSTDGVHYTQLAATAAGNTTYADKAVTIGTRYYYKVQAANVAGLSPLTAAVFVTATKLTSPAAPTNLVVQSGPLGFRHLTWKDNSSNEAGFIVQRSTNGGQTWSLLTFLKPNSTSFTIFAAGKFAYRVYAVNAYGPSAFSNIAVG
jgi:hypothetical protein